MVGGEGVEVPNVKNYKRNYWGTTCQSSYPTAGKIPTWADASLPLSHCDLNLPYNPDLCPISITPIELLSSGRQQELAGYYGTAQAIYSNVVQAYPGTRESYAAALRLKGLGLQDDSEVSSEDLQSLASSVAPNDGFLSTYLTGAAECVRAWQGDREGAQSALVALRDSAATEDEAVVAQKDLLEIETYPAGNGLSTFGVNSIGHMLEALNNLQAFDPEDPFRVQPRGVASLRPTAIRIEKAWPNPFNPSTTLRFQLWRDALTTVRVFNLRGEQVAVLHEGEMSAGSHQLVWQAGSVASGLYVLSVETPDMVAQTKVLYLK